MGQLDLVRIRVNLVCTLIVYFSIMKTVTRKAPKSSSQTSLKMKNIIEDGGVTFCLWVNIYVVLHTQCLVLAAQKPYISIMISWPCEKVKVKTVSF